MPKLVDYAARFEFLRQAAFAVVRDQGPHALSRYTIAAALGTSANTVRRLVAPGVDLRELAADEVQRRRRHGRWGRPRQAEPLALATDVLRGTLPDVPHRIAEELVWLRLEVDAARPQLGEEDVPEALRRDWTLAELGHVPEVTPDECGGAGQREAPDRDDTLALHRAHHEQDTTSRIDHALEALGVQDPAEPLRTRAVVDGLRLAACLGQVTPSGAVEALEHHLRMLTHGLGSTG